MLRFATLLFSLILFLTACTSGEKPQEEEEFPEFTSEQLQEMIKNSPQAQAEMRKAQQAEQGKQEPNNQEMIEQLEQLVQENPNDPGQWYYLAKLYYKDYNRTQGTGKLDKAIKAYSEVIKQAPTHEKGHAYYNRMLCYWKEGKLEVALADLEQFVQVNKDQTPVNHAAMKAQLLYEQENLEAACAAYQTALERWEKDSLPIENQEQWKERCP